MTTQRKRRRRHNGTIRPKIVKLAKIIGGYRHHDKIDETRLNTTAWRASSDDIADIAIAAGLRKERTVRAISPRRSARPCRSSAAAARQPRVLRHLPLLDGQDARRGHVLHADLRARHPRDDGQPEGAARHASGGRPRVRGIHPQPRGEHGRHDPRRLRPHARHPGRERARGHSRRERI